MPATSLHFPPNPHVNQVYLAPNGISYIFTGNVWHVSNTSTNTPTPTPPPVVNPAGPTGPTGPAGAAGTPGAPGPTGAGIGTGIAANLIPAVGNVYSLGDSTHWWKDLWLSANTLYVGGIPLSTSGGQLTLPSLSINNPKIEFGGRNRTSGDISYLTDSSNNLPYMEAILLDAANAADFDNAVSKIKIGDRYTAAFLVDFSHTPEYVFTFQTLPVKTTYSGFSLYRWYVKENNASIFGAYWYMIFDSLNALNIGNTAITTSGGSVNVPGLSIPGSTVSYGPDNNTSGGINYDTLMPNGVLFLTNANADFLDLIKKLKPGDTYTARQTSSGDPSVSVPVTRTFTVTALPDVAIAGSLQPGHTLGPGIQNSCSWNVSEGDYALIGDYSLLTFTKPGTLNIGNMPISNQSGKLVIPNLSVSGTLTTVGTGINPQDTQTPVRFTYVFDVVDHNYYAGFAGIPNAPVGQISITSNSAWPPPTGNYQTDGGGYLFSFSMSSTDSTGNDVTSHLNKLANDSWGSKSIYMTMKDATDSSKYTIFFISTETASPGDITYQFTCQYITGTVGHAYFVSHSTNNKIKVELEFSGTTLGGKIPLNATQQYWWRDSSYGTGVYFATEGYPSLGTASSRALPLACGTLELHPQSSNAGVLGSVTLPNSAEFNGRSINVIIRGNSMAKSSFLNVTGASLSSTIAANTMFTAIFSTTSNHWTVTNVITNV